MQICILSPKHSDSGQDEEFVNVEISDQSDNSSSSSTQLIDHEHGFVNSAQGETLPSNLCSSRYGCIMNNESQEALNHWSLWETMLICRNINSDKVFLDSIKGAKGYHFNFIIIDSVKLPSPFPLSVFKFISFKYFEMMNILSVQFWNNFIDNRKVNFQGRTSFPSFHPLEQNKSENRKVNVYERTSFSTSAPLKIDKSENRKIIFHGKYSFPSFSPLNMTFETENN